MPSIILEKDEEKDMEPFEHPNTPAEQQEVFDVMRSVDRMYELKGRRWREFGDRTLKEYEDDNQKRVNNYVEPRSEDIDDWQTRGFEGITREKMFAFVSKVAMNRPKYKFKATDKEGFMDKIVSEVVEDVYDFTWQQEDPTGVEFFFDAWAAAGSGTVIRWEGVEKHDEYAEDFESYDVATGELKGYESKLVKSETDCASERVPLSEFLWSDWYEPDIQKQAEIARVVDMSRHAFECKYGRFMHADRVPDLKTLKDFREGTFYSEQWDSVETDRVQVVHYYAKGRKSKYRIVANGVLILATPIPRKDGKYPFTRGIFKPFADTRFFCGKALPDEIAHDQDLYNAFKNMVLDRAILHVQRPMIGRNLSEIENEVFRPNGILNVSGEELKPMDFAPPSGNDIQILDYLRGAANRQTSDAQQSGQTGKGVTAREIVIADENARKLAGVFRLFLEDFDLKGAKLRVGSIMQFYFQPTRLAEIAGEGDAKDLAAAYRSFSLENRRLSDKKNGTKVIRVVGTRADLPSREDLDADEETARLQGFEMEKIVITSEYVRNFQMDLTIVPESSFEQSRSLKLAMEDEYLMTVGKLFPNKLAQYEDVLFREFNEAHDKDMGEFERAGKEAPRAALPAEAAGMPGPGIARQLLGNDPNSLSKLVGANV